MFQLVAVEPLDQLLPAVDDELLGQRQRAQPLERARVQLQRALILELLEDVRLHLGDRAFGVDEVVVIELTQRGQRRPRLLLEHLIAPAHEIFGEVRRA